MSKVVVITGTSSGIGNTLATYLTQEGYTVYGLSRKTPEQANFTTIPTDITNLNATIDAIDQIISQEKKIDVLINNAGRGMVGPIEDATDEEILSLFRLNVVGCVNAMKATMPHFRSENKGRIINVSSIGSEMGLPFRGYYSASKAALDKVTEAFRYEVKNFGVDACVLHLGDIKTDIAKSRIQTKIGSEYQEMYHHVFQKIDAHVDEGSEPIDVAKYMAKLIEKKNLKPHYYFGKPMQVFSIFLKKFLPQRSFENLIRKYAGL